MRVQFGPIDDNMWNKGATAQHPTKQINMATEMNERETMAGILERPVRTQMRDNRLASNQFAALMEDEELDHSGYPSMVQKFAANRYVTISNMNEAEKKPSIIHRVGDTRSVGTIESGTVKRNKCSQICQQ